MSSTRQPVLSRRRWKDVLPGGLIAVGLAGLALLAARGLGARFTKSGTFPVSPVLLAVLLGMAWRNVVGVGHRTLPGLEWVTRILLPFGIALVGLRLTLAGLVTVGATALPIAAACIVVAITTAILVGRALGVSVTLQLLIAIGTGVCGCTAIIATAPAIRARPAEISLALSCIVLFGCIGMVGYPWLAHASLAGSGTAAGVFLGSAIHDTSQVIGASLIYSQQFGAPETVVAAGATKLLRNISMVLLVPLAVWWARRAAALQMEYGPAFLNPSERTAHPRDRLHLSQVFPGFVLAFLALVLVRAAGDHIFVGSSAQLWNQAIDYSKSVSEILLTCGICAVGLSVSIADFRSLGWRAACTSFAAAALTAACSFGLTLLSK